MTRILRPLILGAICNMFASGLANATPTSPQKAPSEQTNTAERLISAGRIRQQGQRIAKLYLQIGMDLNADTARKQLDQARLQVDSDLSELATIAGSDKTRPTLERMLEVWGAMKRATEAPFSIERRNLINYLAEDLSLASGKLAMQMERSSDAPVSGLLDLSLRQNMLLQRLARHYLMTHFGDKTHGLQVDIEQTRKEFSAALNELSAARENTKATLAALDLAKMQWVFFEQALDNQKNGLASNPKNVATTSERILEALDSASKQYAQDSGSAARDNARMALTGDGQSRRN